MVNVWTVSGNVGADAELRSTAAGEKVLSFRMANKVGFGDRAVSQWVDVSLWGKRGEAIANYVKKGMKVTVSGELRQEDFTRRDGTPGTKLALRANDVDLPARSEGGGGQSGGGGSYDQSIGSGNRGGGGGADYGSGDAGGKRGGGSGKPAFDQDLDDEIPFIYS